MSGLAEVLAAHAGCTRSHRVGSRVTFTCGTEVELRGGLSSFNDLRHVAAAVTAHLADVLAADATREAVGKRLVAEGGGPGSSIHSWRCEYPDRYGPCSCVDETAAELIAAVREALGIEAAP